MATVAKEKTRKHSGRTTVSVDFPTQNEVITGADYTVRVSAPEEGRVEVAFDQGDWRPCRRSAAFWWCDWSGYGDGEHEVVLRFVAADGRTTLAEPREFFTALSPAV